MGLAAQHITHSRLYTSCAVAILLASYCCFVALASAQPAGTAPRGVGPQDAHLYLPNADDPATWTCLDGSMTIPANSINDDYCDCPDSSDEPGTSACPGAHFYCRNEGHIPANILSSRINDGICEPECCDGSDEFDGRVKCPDSCAKVGREYRKRRQEEENLRRAGAKVRAGYIRETKRKLETLQAEVASLEVEIEVVRQFERAKKSQLERAEQVDQAVIEEKKRTPLYATLRLHQDSLKALAERERRLKDELRKLASLLDDLSSGYNPNYQDMAVKGAVMAYRSWRKGGTSDDDDRQAQDQVIEEEGGDEKGVSSSSSSRDSSAAPVGENIRLKELLDEGDWPRGKVDDLINKETLELLDDAMFKGSAVQKAAASSSADGSVRE